MEIVRAPQRHPHWEELALRCAKPRAVETPAPVVVPQRATPKHPEAISPSYLTHELRAPVTAIKLGLELLQDQLQGRLAPQEKKMLDLATRNSERLEGLVNDIMDYAKISAGKMDIAKEPCDARTLVSDAVESFQSMAIAQGVRLVKEEGEPLPRVMAEPRRILQILTDLISNAVKFTPPRGHVVVSVSPGQYEHRGTLVFKVKDTGRGIPAEEIGKLFDFFVQAGNTKPCEGTGLGLALSRMMVELHGGRIWAESWRGAGSSFFFTIPIAAQDMVQPIEVYPKPVEYSGILVSLSRRLNSFLALFV